MNIQASIRVQRKTETPERWWIEPESASIALDAGGTPKDTRFTLRLLHQTGNGLPEDVTYAERTRMMLSADGKAGSINYSQGFNASQENLGISLMLTTLRPAQYLEATWEQVDSASGEKTGVTAYVKVPVSKDGQQGEPGEPGTPGEPGSPGEPGEPGTPGEDAVSYSFYAEASGISRPASGTPTPQYLRVFLMRRVGSGEETDQTWNEAANGRIQYRTDSGPWTNYGGNCITASTHTGANTGSAVGSMDFRWTPASGAARQISVPVVNDGAAGDDGAPGCIYRMTQWVEGAEYRNDSGGTADTDGLKWIDVVVVPQSDTSTAFDRYVCKKTHTSSASNKPSSTESEWWRKLNNSAPIYTPLLLADDAVVNFTQTQKLQVVVVRKPVIQMGGNSLYPFMAGGNLDSNSPFRIDRNGKMYATGAEVSGTFTATWNGLSFVVADGSQDFMKVETEGGTQLMAFHYAGSSGSYFPSIIMNSTLGASSSELSYSGFYVSNTNGSDTGINPGSISMTGPSGQIINIEGSLTNGVASVQIQGNGTDGDAYYTARAGGTLVRFGVKSDGKPWVSLPNIPTAITEVAIGEVYAGEEQNDAYGRRYRPLFIRTN